MKLAQLREKLRSIFSLTKTQKADMTEDTLANKIDGMSDEELVKFGKMYRRGVHTATPVFNGATEEEIKEVIEMAGFDTSGQAILYDGRTGEPFDKPVTGRLGRQNRVAGVRYAQMRSVKNWHGAREWGENRGAAQIGSGTDLPKCFRGGRNVIA